MPDAEDFRRFALDVYASAGVAPASVLLQDRCDVDVNLLLFVAFVSARGEQSFTDRDLGGAYERVQRWQQDVIRPLRAIRRGLKSGPPPAPNAATAIFREEVQRLELAAEMIEIEELAKFRSELTGPSEVGEPTKRAKAALHAAVRMAAARQPTVDECRAITVIACAAVQHGARVK